MNTSGYIYIISAPTLNGIKVGKTTNARGLSKRYKTFYGETMDIITYQSPEINYTEKLIHKILSEHNISNEIFTLESLDKAKDVCEKLTSGDFSIANRHIITSLTPQPRCIQSNTHNIPASECYYYLVCFKVVTKKDIIKLCELLEEYFSENSSGAYKFAPERISEGGIVWEDWPGKKEGEYKSLRLGFRKWPSVTYEVKDQWKNSEDKLMDIGDHTRTSLRSSDGTPMWSSAELNIFKRGLDEIGMIPIYQ